MEVNNNVNVNVNVNVNTTTNINTTTNVNNTTGSSSAATTQETENTKDKAAVYEPSSKKEVYKPDTEKIKQMIEESNQKSEQFRMLVERLLNKQGKTAEKANSGLKNLEELLVPIDEETRLQAQKDIEEGGYYSVEKTSERILDFAKALSGGDPSKIDTLRDAFKKGYGQAEEAWGGKLPEISQKTYDAVMKGFDEWEKASKSPDVAAV